VFLIRLFAFLIVAIGGYFVAEYVLTGGSSARMSELSTRLRAAQEAFEEELNTSNDDLTSDYLSRKGQ